MADHSSTDDLVSKENLDEKILGDCLSERYYDNIIYTYVGDILIAVNPYEMLPIYSKELSVKYCGITSKADLPPHLYAIAVGAYNTMIRNNQPQVTVISGESGAGKTESTKHFMRQVMTASSARAGQDLTSHELHPVEKKIIQTNPILEAFGNAQTVMNDNSSRFGKFIELRFSPRGTVVGANMYHYLLEKARVVQQGPGERNFHIFEYIIAGGDQNTLHLNGISDYFYCQSRLNDLSLMKKEYAEVIDALNQVGFSSAEVTEIQQTVAAILLIGNIKFNDTSSDEAEVGNKAVLEAAAKNFGVTAEKLETGMMTSALKLPGNQVVIRKLSVKDAQYSRDAVSKAVYDRLFTWLVTRLDLMLSPSDDDVDQELTIGILDIFGFEDFKSNGFDQMCINLANENLHYFFNQHIFAEEILAYKAEGIDNIEEVFFTDNETILDLFLGKVGLLSLLDETTNFPAATDTMLIDKLKSGLKENDRLEVVRGDYAFIVHHYAGPITYQRDGLIEKNKDPLPNQMAPNMEGASNETACLLFKTDYIAATRANYIEAAAAAEEEANHVPDKLRRKSKFNRQKTMKMSKKRAKKRALETVAYGFRKSLTDLMAKMNLCKPHFVRCIKPNLDKAAKDYVHDIVEKQLKYTGMLQTIQMRREGYPTRLTWEELLTRYQGIALPFHVNYGNNKEMALELMRRAEAKQNELRKEQRLTARTQTLDGWLPARSKMFLKYWHTDVMDNLLKPFDKAAFDLQSIIRGFNARAAFQPKWEVYQREQALKASFLIDIKQSSQELVENQQTLIAEENHRGLKGLGLLEEVSKKEEQKLKKKMEKEAQKAVKDAQKKVDASKVQQLMSKNLDKKQQAAVAWWTKYEKKRGVHLDSSGEIFPWFHGLISRKEAEHFLFGDVDGTYLVRVSEKANGYALSLKYKGRVNHYKVSFSHHGGYYVLGSEQDFPDLEELVEFYKTNDLSSSGDRLKDPLFMEHDLDLNIGKSNVKGATKITNYEEISFSKESDESLEPLEVEEYLKCGGFNKPSWLRGKMSRAEAEQDLLERGLVDGRFLVRERDKSDTSITFAISYSCDRKFYHHLLKRKKGRKFLLNSKPLRCDYLEDAVDKFQEREYPGFACRLVPDPEKKQSGKKGKGKKKKKGRK